MDEAGRETLIQRPFLDQARWDTDIAELATRQHGVFSLGQLRDIGLATATVRHRAARGRLNRLHRGVYSLVPTNLLAREGWWMAAVLVAGPGAVLSHRKAGALHELLSCNRANIEVTVPARTSRCHPGIDIHRSSTLTEADITVVKTIPCTNVARTLFDLAQDPTCPARRFALHCLYIYAADSVRTDFRAHPKRRLRKLVEEAEDHGDELLDVWAHNTRVLIARPELFEYHDWCEGGLVRSPRKLG